VLVADLSITTGVFILGVIFLDLIYGLLDPRIRTGD
jgi:peptide/nickel transport system permease protein